MSKTASRYGKHSSRLVHARLPLADADKLARIAAERQTAVAELLRSGVRPLLDQETT